MIEIAPLPPLALTVEPGVTDPPNEVNVILLVAVTVPMELKLLLVEMERFVNVPDAPRFSPAPVVLETVELPVVDVTSEGVAVLISPMFPKVEDNVT